MIVEQTVVPVNGMLMRWKCPGCKKTATAYPDFALPYKRYTLPTLMAFSQAYVNEPTHSYRRLVDGCPLPHQVEPGSKTGHEPMMEHSTIHRWITTLGGYSRVVQNATDLMVQANPTTSLCRDLAGLKISPLKYMSSKRKQILLTCSQLVTLAPLYLAQFGVPIFPKLATRAGYT